MLIGKQLSASRAKDRAAMSERVFEAMMAAGAVSIDRETPSYAPREIRLRIEAPGGAYIYFEIDGDLPDIFGGTWNTKGMIFINPALGDVNPFHFGKLNRLYRDFDYAVSIIACDLARFADGSGYMADTDPRIVAMRSRYRKLGWTWGGQAA
jgi:hypothetical protein